jgi:hypothetical protein
VRAFLCLETTNMTDRYMRLVAHITDEMRNDDDDQSERLAALYETADEKGKDILDQAFICLCGWSLKTLMANADLSDSTAPDDQQEEE